MSAVGKRALHKYLVAMAIVAMTPLTLLHQLKMNRSSLTELKWGWLTKMEIQTMKRPFFTCETLSMEGDTDRFWDCRKWGNAQASATKATHSDRAGLAGIGFAHARWPQWSSWSQMTQPTNNDIIKKQSIYYLLVLVHKIGRSHILQGGRDLGRASQQDTKLKNYHIERLCCLTRSFLKGIVT